jgi:hypothetical protein
MLLLTMIAVTTPASKNIKRGAKKDGCSAAAAANAADA